MGIKISVPEDLGGALRVLPEDTYEAAIQDLFYGISRTSSQPKVTLKWTVQSEYSGKHDKDYITTVGETVLESYSLQPKALWKLNNLYKLVTGDRLPHADYEPEEFVQMIKDSLVGSECVIDVATEEQNGSERSVVKNVAVKPKTKKGKK